MIENVISKSPVSDDPQTKSLVVIDAGIATEENLTLIREKDYNYLCVSRKRLTDYELKADSKTVIVHDCKKREIRLQEVEHKENGDYYLQINSPAKEWKESSMKRQFRERFEDELQKDKRSDAHLFLGLLAYWIVNTIRHQFKESGNNHYWTEITRIMPTQKVVTTEAVNALEK